MARRMMATALVGVLVVAACTFDGLDQYTSGDATTDVKIDTSPYDGGGKPDACVPQCAGKTCGPDGCNGQCAPGCGANECVNGQCVSCVASWQHSFSGVGGNRHAFDGAGFRMYWAGSRPVDGGLTPGYLAAIDTCTGAVMATADPPKYGTATVFGVYSLLSLAQGKLYGNAQTAPSGGHFAVFDPTSFTTQLVNDYNGPSGDDATWMVNSTPSGSVWSVGWTHDSAPNQQQLWVSRGDGTASAPCTENNSAPAPSRGRGVVTSGTSVYVMYEYNAHAYVAAFDDGVCATQCPCSPTWTTSGLLVGAATDINVEPTVGVVQSGVLYIAGFDVPSSGDMFGFIVSLTLSNQQWGATVATYNPTTGLDGLTGLAVDGTTLYASGAKSFTTASQRGTVVKIGTNLVGSPAEVVSSATISPIWTVDVDTQHNLYVSGGDITGGAAKCAGTTCP